MRFLLVRILTMACGLMMIPFEAVRGQASVQEAFLEAWAAWREGRFLSALELLENLLSGPEGGSLRREIALLTGELHPTEELSPDGRAVRWSPDGTLLAFEKGTGADAVTHVLRLTSDGVTPVGVMEGQGLVFSPDGRRVAWVGMEDRGSWEAARSRLLAGVAADDRAALARLRPELERLEAEHQRVKVRDLVSGEERSWVAGGLRVQGILALPPSGEDLYLWATPLEGEGVAGLYRLRRGEHPVLISPPSTPVSDPFMAGDRVVYGTGRGTFAVQDPVGEGVRQYRGWSPVASREGRWLAFLAEEGSEGTVNLLDLGTPGGEPQVVGRFSMPLSRSGSRACPTCPSLGGLALSPGGRRIAVQAMPREDWEIFLLEIPPQPTGEGGTPLQVTREIQHDLYPLFLTEATLLAMKGEARHRRAHLYDLRTGQVRHLFHNNTVRTLAFEYEWAPSPDGRKLLVVADRDGNTISPERGVYLVHLDREVSQQELRVRLARQRESERKLLAEAERAYGPIREEVRDRVARISIPRLFRYQEDLFRMGSKNITQPGNAKAIAYLEERLREFGYEPELQWFETRGVRTANVIARLPGTVSPDVVYTVGTHFDSAPVSPGADDNTSGTVGLLEMARVLAGRPLPATVEIVFFTGEESGLLGSREYVRRAFAEGKKIAGVLNNDMVGFAEDHRLDNTIRFSNKGIRDLQHGAALLFSEMTLYDAEYYRGTDAAAFYEAFGDIVGGIGSYPILASPHYHQSHDVLETINHRLVAEVARVTTASAMLLASSPSRLTGLEARWEDGRVVVRWNPSPESDVVSYRVAWGPQGNPFEHTTLVREPRAALEQVPPGGVVSVRAVNRRGLEGWDWARVPVGGQGSWPSPEG